MESKLAKNTNEDAKSFERVGKRLRPKDNKETAGILLDDAFHNVEKTLELDGNTGALGTRDGVLRGKPQMYKGFFVQIFGMVRYSSDLDVFGKMFYFGWAKREVEIKGQKQKIEFATENVHPLGFESERDAGNWLFKMVDLYYGGNKN